jgi:hypothetical protein
MLFCTEYVGSKFLSITLRNIPDDGDRYVLGGEKFSHLLTAILRYTPIKSLRIVTLKITVL